MLCVDCVLFPEILYTLFEPLIGESSIQYANGLDWEERRKALYPTLRDECLEGYIPCFIRVRTPVVLHNDPLQNCPPDPVINVPLQYSVTDPIIIISNYSLFVDC